jgi:hypothetical protein
MGHRLSSHVRAFLKCFLAVLVATSAVILAISNAASAYKQVKAGIMWIAEFVHGPGQAYAIPAALAACVVAAALIASHRHLRHRIPGAKNRLLGGGALSFLLAVLLAVDAHEMGRHHSSGGKHSEGPQIGVASVIAQPTTGGEDAQTVGTGSDTGSGTDQKIDMSDQYGTSQPKAQEAVLSGPTPVASSATAGYHETEEAEETGGEEETGEEEAAPDESEEAVYSEPSGQASDTAVTNVSSSTSTSATATATASVAVYSSDSSGTTETTTEATTSPPSEAQTTETSETTYEAGAPEGGCPEQ